MSFELIMLLGFFGAGLISLLPENPEQPAEDDLCSRHSKQSSAANRTQQPERCGRRGPAGCRLRNFNQIRNGNRAAA